MEKVKRYFFTHPLAVAWMNDRHGMRFCFPDGREVPEDMDINPSLMGFKFYIHPDSLHLLEPQVGDIFMNIGSDPLNGVEIWESPQIMDKGCLNIHNKYQKNHLPKIIQRNSIAFMWPKSE